MDRTTGKLEEENIIEYNRFIAKNPKSFTSKLAKILLENNGAGYDKLKTLIEKEQDNYFK